MITLDVSRTSKIMYNIIPPLEQAPSIFTMLGCSEISAINFNSLKSSFLSVSVAFSEIIYEKG